MRAICRRWSARWRGRASRPSASRRRRRFDAAEALILPGVGHFGQLMRTLAHARAARRRCAKCHCARHAAAGHLPRSAGAFRGERRSAGRRRAGHFPGAGRGVAAHGQAAAHGLESAAPGAPFGSARRRSGRRVFLLRAYLCGAGRRRGRRGLVRSCRAVRGCARTRKPLRRAVSSGKIRRRGRARAG